jgi:spermidine/putrescine transport system permease protein
MKRTSPPLLTVLCALLFIFMYAPLLVLIVFSFTPTEYGISWQGFTLKWYQEVFTNKNIQSALKVSLMVAIPCVLISTAIGTLTAFVLYRSRFLGKGLFQGILYIPLIMPDLVMGVTLLLLFTFVGLSLGVMSILLAHVSFSIPLATLVIIARMQRIDRRLEDGPWGR